MVNLSSRSQRPTKLGCGFLILARILMHLDRTPTGRLKQLAEANRPKQVVADLAPEAGTCRTPE